MSATDWKRIKDVFHEALRFEAGEQRTTFLDRACGDNTQMRIEVVSLLNSLEEAQDFLERPAITSPSVAHGAPRLGDGQQLSHYKIVSHVATGGMGEVYLAEDQKLRRKVALKVLNDVVDISSEQLRRFEREATLVSSLNHPNVLTVFDIDVESNIHLIASEFVDGITLRKRLDQGRIPFEESVAIVVQALSALRAAHEAGIIHRDIKPENIMVREDGLVKVLDFGVAKVTKPEKGVDGKAITWEQIFSRPGVIMGTAAYMSPEQARGKRLDARTDIFSCGVVFYEMLTGRPPFRGQTATDIVAALIQDDVAPASSVDPHIPRQLDGIVTKMLQKERAFRYATAAEVLADLREIGEHRGAAEIIKEPKELSPDQPTVSTAGWDLSFLLLLIAVGIIALLVIYIIIF